MAQTARGIFFTALLLGAGLLGAGLLVSISNAQSPTDVQNLQELILTESQTLDLKPGAYRYKILTLKANSKLRLFGSTSILAGKVITEKGARIECHFQCATVPAGSTATQQSLHSNAF